MNTDTKSQINNTLKQLDYQVYRLMGDRNKQVRQDFMTLITGNKLPKAKCGITALEYALIELAGIDVLKISKFEIPEKLYNHFNQ